jgi:prepilin signal peptidase PulO-like enzyme (type II secretory pathway)
LGGGDIKLLAGIGALLGWYPALMVIFLSSVLGSLYGIFMMIAFKKGRLTEIPFGPFIGASAILYHFIMGRVI